jgi:hypothetical protein
MPINSYHDYANGKNYGKIGSGGPKIGSGWAIVTSQTALIEAKISRTHQNV